MRCGQEGQRRPSRSHMTLQTNLLRRRSSCRRVPDISERRLDQLLPPVFVDQLQGRTGTFQRTHKSGPIRRQQAGLPLAPGPPLYGGPELISRSTTVSVIELCPRVRNSGEPRHNLEQPGLTPISHLRPPAGCHCRSV